MVVETIFFLIELLSPTNKKSELVFYYQFGFHISISKHLINLKSTIKN